MTTTLPGLGVWEATGTGVLNRRTQTVMFVESTELNAHRLAAYLNESVDKYVALEAEVVQLRSAAVYHLRRLTLEGQR